jgi:hypothetical protein
MEKVDKRECWIWRGATSSTGYGNIEINGKQTGTHRLSYELHHGPIPDGMHICHRCDVRNCVNPEHLFLGSARDNMLDKIEKNRQNLPKGDKHWLSGGGDKHPMAKFNRQIADEIRALYATGMKQTEIAKMYGIAQTGVSDIVRGKRWAD